VAAFAFYFIRKAYRWITTPINTGRDITFPDMARVTLSRCLLLVMTIYAAAHPKFIKSALLHMKEIFGEMAIQALIPCLDRLFMLHLYDSLFTNR
jgi:hypothetical protein